MVSGPAHEGSGHPPLVFVNYSEETFTPTASGALATYIWECVRSAHAEGDRPIVISRRADAAPFPLEGLHVLDYPAIPRGDIGTLAMRAQRKLVGLPRLGLKGWAARVARQAVATAGSRPTLILQNDVELLCLLRDRLPEARLVLLFQNQLPAREPFRSRLPAAADAVAAVSAFTAAWVADHYQLAPGSVEVIHSGVDQHAFFPGPSHPQLPTIGFVGRTGIEKAPDMLLEAALRVSDTTTRFRLQIVGSNHWGGYEEDAYQRRLNAQADALAARGVEIRRPGHVARPDLPAWLRRTDVHVVPSRWEEPFGLTTLEGMAAGNALVASRTGGTPEVVGDAGQLFTADAADELARVLLALVQDESARADWGARARARAEEFTWTATYRRLRAWATGGGAR